MNKIRQCVILAGGRGERLRPLTDTIPKVMAPVCGRPFLSYLIELLHENGIQEIILLVGYLYENIIDYVGDGSRWGIRIRYSIGDVKDETGTRIRNASPLLDDVFFLMYGDNYWPLNVQKIIESYRMLRLPALMAVYDNEDGLGEYGFENNVRLGEGGRVLEYSKTQNREKMNAIDIGTFILTKKLVRQMPLHNFSLEKDFLPKLIQQGLVGGYVTNHRYYPITSQKHLQIAEKFFTPKKIIFLDRDGVINKSMPAGEYVKNWSEFDFLPGVLDALKLLTKHGYSIFIVTNQRGIARGLMTKNDLAEIHQKMTQIFSAHNIHVEKIYSCPHDQNEGCFCRKPKAGMLIQASKDYFFDPRKAIFIGNDEVDYQAGNAIGCKTRLVDEQTTLLDIIKELP